MSTIVAVKKGNLACIAADSLTCLGSTKESAKYIADPSKIVKVGGSYIAIVGHASWQLVLKNYFVRFKRKAAFDSAKSIFETVGEMHHYLKEKYYLNPKEDEEDPFESSQLDALVANSHGIFGIYSLRSVQEYSRFYARGTGARYALGAMYAVYDDKDNSASDIARIAVEASAEFDDGSALPMDLFTVKLSGHER